MEGFRGQDRRRICRDQRQGRQERIESFVPDDGDAVGVPVHFPSGEEVSEVEDAVDGSRPSEVSKMSEDHRFKA